MNGSHESRSFEPPNVLDMPRSAYFGAKDRPNLAGRKPLIGDGSGSDLQSIEGARRGRLAETMRKRAEDVVAGIRALRSLDATGHTEAGVSHLAESVRDLELAFANLRADVEQSLDRIRTNREITADLQGANPAIGRSISEEALEAAVDAANGIGAINFAEPPTPAIFDARRARALAAARRKGGRA